MSQQNISTNNIKAMIRRSHKNRPIEKISLDREGMLLRCRKNTKLRQTGGKRSWAVVQKGDILLYLGCWFFPEKIKMTEYSAPLLDDKYLWSAWNYSKYNAILNFLAGDQILKIDFPGLDPRLKELGGGSLAEQSLYKASLFMYMHFEVAMPKGE